MGTLFLNSSGNIVNFNIELVTEPSGHVVAHVAIETDSGDARYRVSADDRHPNIDDIVSRFQDGLQTAKDTDANFRIVEYVERSYLFVIYPNGEQEQYTGSCN